MEEIPTSIGRFRVESQLGKGAMGVVYRAHDPDIDRTVAIKLIRTDLLDGESREGYLARFRNEAKVAGRCVHPNIVAVYDYALHADNPYLVMEFVDGVDIGRAFRRGTRIPMATVCRISLQVLSALGYAHRLGVVHRDIKPANILLTQDSGLKVTDFGISRLSATGLTQNTSIVGTPSYMSPEQCHGGTIDQRCDLFSLGCVMQELLSGERVFDGASFAETLYKVTNVPHRSVREMCPEVPQALADIIDRALAKRPEDRFENAASMAAAIRSLDGADESDDEPATIVVATGLAARSGDTGAVTGSGGALARDFAPGAASASFTTHDLAHLDAASLTTIERQLADHLGPMAGFHLRRALRDAQSADQFSRILTDLLPAESQRVPLRGTLDVVLAGRDFNRVSQPSGHEPDLLPKASANISDARARQATQALAQVIGPIASRLVAKLRTKAASISEFERLCEETIDQPEDRRRFRRSLERAP